MFSTADLNFCARSAPQREEEQSAGGGGDVEEEGRRSWGGGEAWTRRKSRIEMEERVGVWGGGGGARTRDAGAGIVVMTDLILDRYTNQPLFLRFVESCITYKCLKSCFSPVTKAVDKLFK